MLRIQKLPAFAPLLAAALLAACSPEVRDFGTGGAGGTGGHGAAGGTGTGGAGGTGTGGSIVHAEPPSAGPTHPPDGTGSATFAISKLYLGDTDRDGASNVDGWKQYGFDLDGLVSTPSSADLCMPRAGATPKDAYPDGDLGIDNAYGKSVLPQLLALTSNLSQQVNDSILAGESTIMLDLDKLGADADYNPISTRLYGGAPLGGAPKFDGSDAWPVVPELLKDPTDITSSTVVFPTSYVVKNTWVGRAAAPFPLTFSTGGSKIRLTIANAVIAMDMSADHGSATQGTIAGVLATDALLAEIKKVAGAFDPGLCSSPTLDALLQQIEQASDILADGTQDPTKICDGISIGLGFDAKRVKLGPIAAPAPPDPDPCAPCDPLKKCKDAISGQGGAGLCPGSKAALAYGKFLDCLCAGPCQPSCFDNYCVNDTKPPSMACSTCALGPCLPQLDACQMN